MITEAPVNNIKTSGVQLTKEMGINREGMGFIQNILRSSIYADSITSCLREGLVNSRDSHVEAGKADLPVQITLPTKIFPTLKIRDFGVSMSEDTILNLYCYLGASSKRNSNDLCGFMGIGKISFLAYSDSFLLTAFLGGNKRIYNIYVDSESLTQVAKLSEEPTDEPDGVEITMAVKQNDIDAFRDKAYNLFRYFKVKPIVKGAKFEYETKKPILQGPSWFVYGSGESSVVVMGDIGYKIESQHFTDSKFLQLINSGLEIHCSLGSLDVAASRESLRYSKKTIQTIEATLTAIHKEVAALINEKFKNCATIYDAKVMYNSIYSTDSGLYSLRDLVKGTASFNNTPITSNDLRYTAVADGAYRVSEFVTTWRSNTKVKANVAYTIQCQPNTVVVYNDLDIANGITNRVYDLVVNKSKRVYVISANSPANRKKILDELQLVDSNLILLSSLPKISLASTTGNGAVKNSKHQSKEFSLDLNFKSNSYRHRAKSDYWKAEILDVQSDSGVYVILQSFEYINKNKSMRSPSELQGIIKSLETLIKIPKIYGIKIQKRDEVSKNKNMVCLWDYISTELTAYFNKNNIAQKVADRLDYQNNCSFNWLDFLSKNGDKCHKKTLAFKTAKIIEFIKHDSDKKILDAAIRWKEYFTPVKPKFSMAKLGNELEKHYGLLKVINFGWSFQATDSVVQYINMIG